MRPLSLLLASTLLVGTSMAWADSRVFVVASQRDGYGIDRCLANGEQCGAPAARAYCQSHHFRVATAFHRVQPEEVTGVIPTSDEGRCAGSSCDGREYIAITCER
ncbi:hypothetical protein X566_18315 [Afipia sp. P52-10]|jgi:hypothetical protein|nr:hypothetical protein [Afipia sp. P52-10]ETR74775.1 hypothetical protein X566_18315 [Afipia sp. P52-10]